MSPADPTIEPEDHRKVPRECGQGRRLLRGRAHDPHPPHRRTLRQGACQPSHLSTRREGLVLTATKSGAPTNPDWYYNLKEHLGAGGDAELVFATRLRRYWAASNHGRGRDRDLPSRGDRGDGRRARRTLAPARRNAAGFRRIRDQDLTHLPHVQADTPLVAPTNRTPSSTDASSYRLAAMGRTGVHLLRPHQPEAVGAGRPRPRIGGANRGDLAAVAPTSHPFSPCRC